MRIEGRIRKYLTDDFIEAVIEVFKLVCAEFVFNGVIIINATDMIS